MTSTSRMATLIKGAHSFCTIDNQSDAIASNVFIVLFARLKTCYIVSVARSYHPFNVTKTFYCNLCCRLMALLDRNS